MTYLILSDWMNFYEILLITLKHLHLTRTVPYSDIGHHFYLTKIEDNEYSQLFFLICCYSSYFII